MSLARFAGIVSLVFTALGATACTHATEGPDAFMPLPSDGYLLVRARHPRAVGRVGVLVDLHAPPPGTYVLVHSRTPPRDTGWFSLDVAAYEQCSQRARSALDTELDCILQHGRGEVVDLVTVEPRSAGEEDRLHGGAATAAVLRHAECADADRTCGRTDAWSDGGTERTTSWTGYYGVMRVAPAGEPVEVTVESLALDADGARSWMTVERL